MKSVVVPALALLLTASAAPVERGHEMLMNLIEHTVKLPKGAHPLSDYARYYAERGNDEVVAVYLVPVSFDRRPSDLAAGERRWIKNPRDLPYIFDGGCLQITVIFDRTKSVVKNAECNGFA